MIHIFLHTEDSRYFLDSTSWASFALENKVLTSILDFYGLTGKSEFPADSLLDHIVKMNKISIDTASFLKTLIYLRDNGLILLPFGVRKWNDITLSTFFELTSKGIKKVEEIEEEMRNITR